MWYCTASGFSHCTTVHCEFCLCVFWHVCLRCILTCYNSLSLLTGMDQTREGRGSPLAGASTMMMTSRYYSWLVGLTRTTTHWGTPGCWTLTPGGGGRWGRCRSKVPYYNSLIPKSFSLLVLIVWSMVTRVGKTLHESSSKWCLHEYNCIHQFQTNLTWSVQCSTNCPEQKCHYTGRHPGFYNAEWISYPNDCWLCPD